METALASIAMTADDGHMSYRWIRRLVAAVAVVFSSVLPAFADEPATQPATRPAATPAMYRLADENTTVYVLGSIHVLPKDLQWRSERLDDILDEASAVYFEIPITPMELLRAGFVMANAGALPADERLRDMLTEDQWAQVQRAAQAVGLNAESLDRFEPWMAALTLSTTAMQQAGLSSGGVDVTLALEAQQRQLPVRGLETIEDQVAVFESGSEEEQIEGLMSTIDSLLDDEGQPDLTEIQESVDKMLRLWTAGDAVALEAYMREEMGDDEAMMEALLDNRNRNWVEDLTTLMEEEEGTFLVVVGAGHLAGEAGLLPLMEEAGYAAEQVK